MEKNTLDNKDSLLCTYMCSCMIGGRRCQYCGNHNNLRDKVMFDLLDLVPEEKIKEETSEEQNSTFWVVWSVL